MDEKSPDTPPQPGQTAPRSGAAAHLFLVSVVILFLELACIRWFPAHVLYLTFFTNIVLLASFLGMSLGCLAAGHQRNYLSWTPALLATGIMAALIIDILRFQYGDLVHVGDQGSPQMVYFGTEHPHTDLAQFFVPIELLGGIFFVLIALVFVGPGQELGRAFNSLANPIQAYIFNILGSLSGIALFAACCWLELPPLWWFLPVAGIIGWWLFRGSCLRDVWVRWALLGGILVAVSVRSGTFSVADQVRVFSWSPYYRIMYDPDLRTILVNQIGHQRMISRDDRHPAYALPYLLNRDAGHKPFRDVLIIGAGSGNDVSRALQWGAEHIDAVEIDPLIQRLGARDHPDHPYQDSRVSIHLNDGRNFLRSGDRQYDLIVYALVDSLVLHSSFSNIRLESYLFTRQAFADVRRRLKPGGTFVMYNYFRQGWVVARIQKQLVEAFGTEPLVLPLPPRNHIQPDESLFDEFTIFFAGDTDHLRQAFAQHGTYWLATDGAPAPDTPDGFVNPDLQTRARVRTPVEPRPEASRAQDPAHSPTAAERTSPPDAPAPWWQFGLAQLAQPAEPLRSATDDWPFLYLRRPMIPDLTIRSVAVMGGVALILLWLFMPRRQNQGQAWTFNGWMFFLGAGFMLVETKAVVHMALLFGSTWMVNTVVFFGVLVMILLGNLFVLTVRPQRLWPWYVGLVLALLLNALIPMDYFLGMNRLTQVTAASLLVSAPILFAAVIFAAAFSQSTQPGQALGANIAGAILGGLAENVSLLIGFQYVILVALAFYVASAILATVWLRRAAKAIRGL
jgi:hypothetical protein